jgi:hypothetical protein
MTMTGSMTAPRFACLLAVGALVSAFAGGCGGDTRRGEQESSGAVTHEAKTPVPASQGSAPGHVVATRITDPARRAYVARVDSVCGQIDPERGAEQARVGAAKQVGEAVKVYDDSIALGWKELRQIEAIQPPPGDRTALRANVFDVIRSQLALRRRIAKALAAVDVPRLRVLRAEEDNMARALTGFARGYGFRVCGEA